MACSIGDCSSPADVACNTCKVAMCVEHAVGCAECLADGPDDWAYECSTCSKVCMRACGGRSERDDRPRHEPEVRFCRGHLIPCLICDGGEPGPSLPGRLYCSACECPIHGVGSPDSDDEEERGGWKKNRVAGPE